MFKLSSSIPTKKAVAYYRHSAEDKQENSVSIQSQHAHQLAAQHGVEIIHQEADEGVSGLLGPESRPGFKRLLEDWVENPDAPPFDYVFVYDQSRWGRFQNPDEAAHYEFRCTKRGKKIVYVASGWPKEGQELMSSLDTSIKRYMAAEYSRALSDKVFRGCVEVSKQGYSAGGSACYGMTRLLLDADKKPERLLKKGEHKSISNARVTFTLANDQTTDTVREIFNLFVIEQKSLKEVATILNAKGIPSDNGGLWHHRKVLHILTNETYMGTKTYNKKWHRLKQGHRRNPRNQWVIVPNAYPALVAANIFIQAQERLVALASARRLFKSLSIQNARHRMRDELVKFFLGRGMHYSEVSFALKHFPILYGLTMKTDLVAEWCFVINEEMRGCSFVFAIGVVDDKEDPLGKIFAIPSDEFGFGDFSLFSEKDENYARYLVKDDEVEGKVLSVAEELGMTIAAL